MKNSTPFFMRVTSLGLANFLPSKAIATGVFFFVLQVELLDAAIAGVGQQDGVRVEDREAVGAGFAPDVHVGVRGAGRIEEFLEAAFLRPLPHLVAGHVGEQ